MTRDTILTVASWCALLAMFAFIGYSLIPRVAPEYPESTVRYTATSYKSLEFENAMNKANRAKAEDFIRSLADGNLR